MVDGPAASGKGTLAESLAREFGYIHIDSGMLYRAVAIKAMAGGDNITGAINAAKSLESGDLKTGDLRSEVVGNQASVVARIPEVRASVNSFIEHLIATSSGSVMDGRAGAWEYPHAQVKFFLICDVRERARRRVAQIGFYQGKEAVFEEVLRELEERDRRDMNREVAPLRRAPGAIQIDTTKFTKEKTLSFAVAFCKRELFGQKVAV